jgi:Ca2+-binding EF-hand superfamily protein
MALSGISGFNPMMEQFKAFQAGQANIQKADLQALKGSLGAGNSRAARGIDSLLESFDQIDINKDGISFQELLNSAQVEGAPRVTRDPGSGKVEEKACEVCRECGKCGHGAGMRAEGAGRLRGGHPGLMNPEDLPPVSKQDFLAYQDKLQKEGKEVPPELTLLIQSFEAMDADQDGRVAFGEFKSYAQKNNLLPSDEEQRERASRLRSAGDDVLYSKDELRSLKELLARQTQQVALGLDRVISGFENIDENKDGKLNFDELTRFLQSQAKSQAQDSLKNAESQGVASGETDAATTSSAVSFSNPFLAKLAARYGQTVSRGQGSVSIQV